MQYDLNMVPHARKPCYSCSLGQFMVLGEISTFFKVVKFGFVDAECLEYGSARSETMLFVFFRSIYGWRD